MTFNIISDMHFVIENNSIDYGLFDASKLKKADVLVVAGDLAQNEKDYESIKLDFFDKVKDKCSGRVIFIKGNHDYWYKSSKLMVVLDTYYGLEDDRYIYNKKPPASKIVISRYLEDEKTEIYDRKANVAIFGTTLWSPIPDLYKPIVNRCMVDNHKIPFCTADITTECYKQQSKWLIGKVAEAKAKGYKVAVVTHHGPREELIAPEFAGDELNPAFFVMDKSLDKCLPDLWIHGHSHNPFDKIIDGCRYIRNPIGYNLASFDGHKAKSIKDYEIPDDKHWYDNVVEI